MSFINMNKVWKCWKKVKKQFEKLNDSEKKELFDDIKFYIKGYQK